MKSCSAGLDLLTKPLETWDIPQMHRYSLGCVVRHKCSCSSKLCAVIICRNWALGGFGRARLAVLTAQAFARMHLTINIAQLSQAEISLSHFFSLELEGRNFSSVFRITKLFSIPDIGIENYKEIRCVSKTTSQILLTYLMASVLHSCLLLWLQL